jgi:hypothetical protein
MHNKHPQVFLEPSTEVDVGLAKVSTLDIMTERRLYVERIAFEAE